VSLVGTPKTRGLKAGVYIFTHLVSGSQYVGSSNSLSRRLDQYFTFKQFNQENSGQLLPLMKKEGFDKFSLEIFVMPSEFASDYYFLFRSPGEGAPSPPPLCKAGRGAPPALQRGREKSLKSKQNIYTSTGGLLSEIVNDNAAYFFPFSLIII
jgi:hypothetical protein